MNLSLNFDKTPVVLTKFNRYLNAADGPHGEAQFFYETPTREEKEDDELRIDSPETRDNSFCIVWSQLKFQVNETIFNPKEILRNYADKLSQNNNNNKLWPEWLTKKRVIFENLNGTLESGELLAIMGPSGAGKTSLLNALIGKTKGYEGQTKLFSRRRSNERSLKMSFIPQIDHLNEMLTVEENLQFASRIKNVQSNFNHNDNVKRITRILNLISCLHTRCGDISGGEYRRTSIGQELLSNPDLLVMDEPTSGLDSLSCKKLILCLRRLIQDSHDECNNATMSIVVTVHQPSPDVFYMFDKVYIMGPLGKVIYHGCPSDVSAVVNGLIETCLPEHELLNEKKKNPATYMIEMASGIYGQQPIEILSDFQQQQQQHHFKLPPAKLSRLSIGKNDEEMASGATKNMLPPALVSSKLVIDNRLEDGHYWYRLKLLTKREFKTIYRDPLQTAFTIAFFIVVPLLMAQIFSPKSGTINSCPIISKEFLVTNLIDNQSDFQLTLDRSFDELTYSLEGMQMFLFTCYVYSLCICGVAVMTFPMRMHILIKEIRNGWYKQSGFIMAKFFSTFFMDAIMPMLSIMLTYKLTTHPSSYLEWRMVFISIMAAIMSLIASCLGNTTGALLMDSPSAATILAIGTTLPLVTVSGCLIRPKDMTYFIQLASWGSFYRLAFNAILSFRLGFNICNCTEQTEQYFSLARPQFLDVPDHIQNAVQYYIENSNLTNSGATINNNETIFTRMASQISNTLNMGSRTDSCQDYVPIPMTLFQISDQRLPYVLVGLAILLIIHRVFVHVAVNYQLRKRI